MTAFDFNSFVRVDSAKRAIEVSVCLLEELNRYAANLDEMVKSESAEWEGKTATTIVLPSGPDGELEETTDPYEDCEIWRTTSFLPVVTRYSLCAYSFAIFEDCLRRCAAGMRAKTPCGHNQLKLENHKDCLRDCGSVSIQWVNSTEWNQITKVAIVRHAIVHSNGRLASPPNSDKYIKAKAAITELMRSGGDDTDGKPLFTLNRQDQIILGPGSVGRVCELASTILSSLKSCL